MARFLHGRIDIARIDGSTDGLAIQAYDRERRLLVEARWEPRRHIMDRFALQVLSRQEARELTNLLAANGSALPSGRVLTRERAHEMAGNVFSVRHLTWPVTAGPEIRPYLVAACKEAKAEKSDVQISAVDGKFSFAPSGQYEYTRQDLEWIMRKVWTNIRLSDDGVIGLTVKGLVGDYAVYLCGVPTRHPPEASDPQEAKAQTAEHTYREDLDQVAHYPGDHGSTPHTSSARRVRVTGNGDGPEPSRLSHVVAPFNAGRSEEPRGTRPPSKHNRHPHKESANEPISTEQAIVQTATHAEPAVPECELWCTTAPRSAKGGDFADGAQFTWDWLYG